MNVVSRMDKMSPESETALDYAGPTTPDADASHRSLEGMHGSVTVPHASAGFWRQYRAFAGPALLVSVGYMDPGNCATDLPGGPQYKYNLMWVVALSSFMAIFLQVCSARLGIVTGKDLAQACRDYYPTWTRVPNWLGTELAIMYTPLPVLSSISICSITSGTPSFACFW